MIKAILLAAGQSKRMKSENKLIKLYKNKPLINYSLNVLKKSKVNKIIIVLGHQHKEVKKIIKKNKKIIFTYNKNYKKGMASSIKIGLKKITYGYQSFSSDNKREILNIDKFKFIPLICYEIIYSGKINPNKNYYDFILNISEDGWFGKSIGPAQHLSHSIFRSIEEGKNVIRSTNNGVSAFVNPKGQIIKQISEKGYFDVNKIKRVDKTYFAEHGNKIFFYFVIIYTTFIVILKIRENK